MSELNILQTISESLSGALATEVLQRTGVSGAVPVPATYKLVKLEDYKDTPDRYRSTVSTDSVSDFISYVGERANSSNSLVFVESRSGKALAILDAGTSNLPQWGEHRVTLSLQESAPFRSLRDGAGKYMNQQSFVEFLEDWDDNIRFIYNPDSQQVHDGSFASGLRLFRHTKAARSAEATSDISNHSTTGSLLDSVSVSAGGAELPVGFYFECQMYEGYGDVNLMCRVYSHVENNKVSFKYSIKSLEQAKLRVSEFLYTDLSEDLAPSAQVFKGKANLQGN